MPTVRRNFQEANDFVLGKVYALEADTVRRLYDEYVRAYREMSAALSDAWSAYGVSDQWEIADIRAREALLRQIETILNNLDPQVSRLLFDNIGYAYRAGLYGTNYVLDNSVNDALMQPSLMPLLPVEQVAAQATAPYLGQSWVERYTDNRTEFELRIKRSLVQSQIQGESMQDAQKRLAQELGVTISTSRKPERFAHRRAFFRTMMIARTEIMRASNLGAVAVYEANSDVLRGWEFKASLDERTCQRCGPLDGRQFSWKNVPIDGKGSTTETLPPPIHPMCRCAALPALINKELEERIVGKRVTFDEWAARRGITRNQYGQAFDLRGRSAPQLKSQ